MQTKLDVKSSNEITELNEGWLPSGHLDDRAAERPDVSRGAVSTLAFVDDLGGHVLQGSRKRLCHRTKASQSLGSAKVRNLDDSAVRVYEDVISFYVTVHDFLLVQMLQSFENLLGVVRNCAFIFFQWAPLGSQKGRK